MLNKNVNCYNIEKNFKYSTATRTFSEHITIFRTVSINIWRLKCQHWQINKTINVELLSCELFIIIKFFFLSLLRESTLESNIAPTNRYSLVFLLYTSKSFFNVELFSIFAQTFLELIFATKIKTMLLKQSVLKTVKKNIACVRYLNT